MSFLKSDPENIEGKNMSTSEYRNMKVRDFCESTSLHGFSFMYHSKTIATRSVWVIAIVALLGVGTFFLVDNTDAYFKSRLVTNIESFTDDLDVSRSYSPKCSANPITVAPIWKR